MDSRKSGVSFVQLAVVAYGRFVYGAVFSYFLSRLAGPVPGPVSSSMVDGYQIGNSCLFL
jgi:hypothetical protein